MADPEQLTAARVLELFVRSLGPEQAAGLAPELSDTVVGLVQQASDETMGDVGQEVFAHLKEHLGRGSGRRAGAKAPASPLRGAYRRSAAVLTAFDPSLLRPLGMSDEAGGAVAEMAADLVEVYDAPSPRERWMLRPEVREAVLREMGSREELAAALQANPHRPQTPVQHALEQLIREKAPPSLEMAGLQELTAMLQAVRWLQPTKLPLPSPEKLQDAIDRNEVPAVFAKMAGRSFTGREAELQTLREYVGVLPPLGTLRGLRRQIRGWLGLRRKPPLVIYAPGGAGKTTLVSKFLLDHTHLAEELKFPYVYLDFDNPRLSLQDPNTLLDEAIRQLSAQYPEARPELRAFVREERTRSIEQEETGVAAGFPGLSQARQRQAWSAGSAARFAALVRSIVRRNDDGDSYSLPLLLVLDTYEEVQGSGFEQEFRLWELVDSIQAEFETLRTVVCGRAPLGQVPTTGTKTTMLRLEAFDAKSAEAFLRSMGVEDRTVIRQLYDELGGSPLSLKLAAEVYRREGKQPGPLTRGGRTFFFFSAGEGVIQGQLYQRILGHIHDPDVRKLAHPGLVLRRVTPALIREVLQGPCGVPVPNERRAKELFEVLGREVALVTTEPDGSLRHRPDVRRIMLKLLERDKPQQAEAIDRLAVAYYRARAGVPARAEEIYHLLRLRTPAAELERRWLPGVDEFLRGALDELPAESRVFLAARLGVRLKTEDVRAADMGEWERYAAREAGEMIKRGHYEQALATVRERRGRTRGSPLHLIEAKALASLKQEKRAARAIEKAFEAAAFSSNRAQMLEALLVAAQLAWDRGDPPASDEYLRRAGEAAAALGDRVRRIFAVCRRVLLHMRTPAALDPAPGLRDDLASLVGALPGESWSEHRRLLRESVSLLGLDYPDLWLKMLRRVGFGPLDSAQESALADAIDAVRHLPKAQMLAGTYARMISGDIARLGEVRALQQNERLEEYFEKLIPIVLAHPGSSRQVSQALARPYLDRPLVEFEQEGAYA